MLKSDGFKGSFLTFSIAAGIIEVQTIAGVILAAGKKNKQPIFAVSTCMGLGTLAVPIVFGYIGWNAIILQAILIGISSIGYFFASNNDGKTEKP